MQPFLIFLSSPGDVGVERDRAELVVRRINSERKDRRQLQLIRWEDDYYLATRGSFQDQICKPSECDLVVCIFWKRLGSELPDHYARPDGTIPTGTEYEFEDALNAAEGADPRLPGVLVYKKTADITFSLGSLDQERAQYDRFMTFWGRWFRNEKGHFLAGFHSFPDADAFEQMFERNMRSWLNDQEIPIEWKNGSPYRGLEAFGVEHAPVFFGRRRETERARARLIQAAMGDTAFLLVTGASGAGKSSLARAGLIPLLAQPGGLGALSSAMRHAIITPGEIAQNWAEGLAAALFSDHAIAPELEQGDFDDAATLGAQLHRADASAVNPVLAALKRASANLAKSQARTEAADVTLVLLVDQLEEVFAWPKAEAEAFFKVLSLLANAKGHPVWVVATMRSDFQHRLAEYADLDQMAGRSEIRGPGEGERTLELVLPRAADLRDIVLRPAAAAGLSFEVENGRDLAHIIESEARPELMPAIQLLMSELYDRRSGTLLTLEAHDALGGVGGVMAHRGDEVYAAASDAAKQAFPRVVRALVTQVRDDAPASARRVPEAAFDGDAPAQSLLAALKRARLLTSHHGELRLAHESILTGWQKLKDQIAGERRLYEARQRIEETFRRWNKAEGAGKVRDGLLLSGLNLAEGRELMSQWGEASLKDREPGLPAFIAASDARDKRAGRLRMALVSGVAVALALFGGVATKFWRDADVARVAAESARMAALEAKKTTEVALADAVEAKKKATVALKVSESGANLTDGDVGEAAGKAAQAFEEQPTDSTRSAMLQAGLEISPYLERRWQHGRPVEAMAWIDSKTLAIADARNQIKVFDVTPEQQAKTLRTYDLPKITRADDYLAAVLGIKVLNSGVLAAVMNDGSLFVLEPGGAIYPPYRPAEGDALVDVLEVVETSQDHVTLVMGVNREFKVRDCVISRSPQSISCADKATANPGSMDAVAVDSKATILMLAMNPSTLGESVVLTDLSGNRTGDGIKLPTLVEGQVHTKGADGTSIITPAKVSASVRGLALSQDDKWLALASGDRGVSIINRVTWQADKTIAYEIAETDLVSPRMAWRPGTNDLHFTCYTNAVCSRIGQGATDRETRFLRGPRFEGHRSAITLLAWDPTGQRLVTRDTNDDIRIWTFEQSAKVIRHLLVPAVDQAWNVSAISGDGNFGATALSQTEGDFRLFKTGSPKSVASKGELIPTPSDVRSLAFTATRVYAGTVNSLVAATLADQKIDKIYKQGDADIKFVRALAATGRGEEVVALMGEDDIAVFDVTNPGPFAPRLMAAAPTNDTPYRLTADPTRRQALVSYRDGTVQAFSLEMLKHVDTLKNTHAEGLLGSESMSVSSDGKLLATSGTGNYVLLYDLDKRATRARLTAQKGEVIWVTFSPSGKKLAALDTDGKVTIWDMTGAESKQTLAFRTMPLGLQQEAAGRQNAHVNALHWTDDTHLLLVGGIAPVRLLALDEIGWLQRITDLGYRLDKIAD